MQLNKALPFGEELQFDADKHNPIESWDGKSADMARWEVWG
jgi:hypothetical protein